MRKKKTTPPPDPDAKPVFVQLRLTKEMADILRIQGEPANRKLPAEILHRIKVSLAGGSGLELDAGLYGWVNPARDKLLGQAIGILAGDIEEIGPMTDNSQRDRETILAMLKIAAAELFDGLGAREEHMTPDNRAHAALLARQAVNQMRWAGLREPVSPDFREAYPQKAVIDDLGKAWNVKVEKGGA